MACREEPARGGACGRLTIRCCGLGRITCSAAGGMPVRREQPLRARVLMGHRAAAERNVMRLSLGDGPERPDRTPMCSQAHEQAANLLLLCRD